MAADSEVRPLPSSVSLPSLLESPRLCQLPRTQPFSEFFFPQPESEVFEITDFTTASEWERFISKVEEVLNDWKLIGNSLGKPLEKKIGVST
uniref:RAB3 GTPase activating protein catalytic subunit 1 n=1 Tax=Sarcophilus harrisii TaxID=9305 RepID=A0A7N4PCD9_SARHA